MSKRQQPPQQQEHQPGREREMQPLPDYKPKFPGAGKLKDKVALITGGDSGIGRAAAVAMAREGASIAIVYLEEHKDAAETAKAVEAEGSRAIIFAGDIGDEDVCRKAVAETVDAFGRIDILVNNAAEQHETENISEIDSEQLDRTFRTNIYSCFYLAKHAVPHMPAGSTIINTTSIVAFRGHKTLLDYSATKGAVLGFTRALAQALLDKGIRVNAVAPGPIWTPLIPASFSAEHTAKHGGAAPMERPGQPNEVAPSYVFLASAESSYFNGRVLHPNGGTPI